MNRLQRFFALTPLVALAFSAGCQSDAPITGRADTYDRPWLTLSGKDLRADTVVGDARPVRDESGLLRVSIPVRNVTDKQLYVEYRITFTDGNGMEINRYPGTLAIPARQTREAAGNSTSSRAQQFHVELNYPRIN